MFWTANPPPENYTLKTRASHLVGALAVDGHNEAHAARLFLQLRVVQTVLLGPVPRVPRRGVGRLLLWLGHGCGGLRAGLCRRWKPRGSDASRQQERSLSWAARGALARRTDRVRANAARRVCLSVCVKGARTRVTARLGHVQQRDAGGRTDQSEATGVWCVGKRPDGTGKKCENRPAARAFDDPASRGSNASSEKKKKIRLNTQTRWKRKIINTKPWRLLSGRRCCGVR